MRVYELMLLFYAQVDQTALESVLESTGKMLADQGGTILHSASWGRRKLAYPINDQSEGNYVLQYVELDPAALKDVEFNFKLNEDLLRYMFVRSEYSAVPKAAEAPVEEEVGDDVDDAEETDTDDKEEVVAEEVADADVDNTETDDDQEDDEAPVALAA